MAEIQMERCSDLLYVKVQIMHTVPQEYANQDSLNSTCYQSPFKQQRSFVKPQTTPKVVILKDSQLVDELERDKSAVQIDTFVAGKYIP